MRFLLLVMMSVFMCPSFALSKSSTVLAMALEEDAEADKCYFDLTVTSDRAFGDWNSADIWCGGVHKLFGFDRSCYPRRHGDGRWIANFRHQRRFYGSSFDSIFRSYTQWSDRHLFRGAQFQHQLTFQSRCFGRGNGGGGYP